MKKYYKYIIVIEILILAILIVFQSKNRINNQENEDTSENENYTSELESIFTILPYEEDNIAIYFYPETRTFEIEIKSPPYDRNLEYALSIMHNYKETANYTEEDIRIVAPSFMLQK